MKESSEDILIKNIIEVLEQYEPEYSPYFWERIRKQRPVPELKLRTLLLKYKFWLSVFLITGGLIIVYKLTIVPPLETISATEPVSSESSVYFASEEPTEISDSEKTSSPDHNSISKVELSQEGKSISSKVLPARITDPLSAASLEYIPPENVIADRPEGFEKIPVPVSLEEIDFINQYNPKRLLAVEYQPESNQLSKGQANDNMGKLEFHWPDFKSLITSNEDYDKFAGPNKLALFYSPEIHFSDSIKTIGLSQGIGVSFEGPIRSLISVSAGVSYQSINFNDETIFSGKVPPPGPFQPPDTNRTYYMIDSIEIRSGSYKFLELPVSLNFKFLEATRSEVWLGIGISSVAFLGQEYTYETLVEEVSESSSVSVKAWENIHPLASLNFSLLCRYNLSYRSYMHASIQYKQHLVPMGYNSMKLNRLNFQVGIIYRFGRED